MIRGDTIEVAVTSDIALHVFVLPENCDFIGEETTRNMGGLPYGSLSVNRRLWAVAGLLVR